ncbi:MAG: hypothetical protein DRJ41_02315 [Thermoprotei archaeon]|nr:MAG: hypothetical protein DRJ41_02315 [Thermoprotei archaeon]
MGEEAEIKGEKLAKRVVGLLVLIAGLAGFYSGFEVARYILGLREGSSDFFVFNMEVMSAAAFTLLLSYIVYKNYIRFK